MITIEFAQEGQALRLTSDSVPVQFSDGLPVQIVVDANYVSATELYLMTRPNKGAAVAHSADAVEPHGIGRN